MPLLTSEKVGSCWDHDCNMKISRALSIFSTFVQVLRWDPICGTGHCAMGL
jgi:hypothetical protein